MNKILYLLIILSFSSHAADDKGIRFTEGSWADILSEAKKQNKLIFIDIYTTWCGPCKLMSAKVFTDTNVGEKFNESFINYKIDAEKGEGIELAKNYAITAYPTYLFVNSSGELVYRALGAMPADKFITEADKAISTGKNYKSSSELEKAFKEGRRDPDFLYEYMKRKSLNGSESSVLLDEYLAAIPTSLYKTEKVLALIAENIGTIESKAFVILRDALDRYLNMTTSQQKYVLNGISKAKRNTFKKAVDSRDKALLERLIDAVRATSYSEAGFEAEEKQFRLEYAKITRDGDNFKKIATKEAAKLMGKTSEDLVAETQLKIMNFKEGAKAKNLDETTPQFKMILDNLTDNAQKTTSFQLNEYAWGYVQMINTPKDLEEALKWSERAIELVESPANLDTYANLLSKLGRKKEAIKAEKRAIKLAKKEGGDTKDLQQTLKDIKRS
ncbi:MAG: thioredoxin fold domain-containing protein [Emticicia sp.]|uniref:thioredoxin family protein n=1 Tax=Emticicia sp. TaxID=1930953 RepID=UPI003BA3FD21